MSTKYKQKRKGKETCEGKDDMLSQLISNPNAEDVSKEGGSDINVSYEEETNKIVENPPSNFYTQVKHKARKRVKTIIVKSPWIAYFRKRRKTS